LGIPVEEPETFEYTRKESLARHGMWKNTGQSHLSEGHRVCLPDRRNFTDGFGGIVAAKAPSSEPSPLPMFGPENESDTRSQINAIQNGSPHRGLSERG
jgi:hypothetical protein